MDTRKVSAAVGFTILIGCVVAVVVIIFQGGSARTSYRASMEESWKKREMRMKERQEVLGTISTTSTAEPSIKEAKKLAEELERLFISKKPEGMSRKVGGSLSVVHGDEQGNKLGIESDTTSSKNSPEFAMKSDKLPESSQPQYFPSSFPQVLDDLSSQLDVEEGNSQDKEHESIEQVDEKENPNENEFYQSSPIPSINSRLQKIVQDQMSQTRGKHKSNILLVQSSLPSAVPSQDTRHSSASKSSAIYPDPPSNLSYGSRKEGFSGPSYSSVEWVNDETPPQSDEYVEGFQYGLEEKEEQDLGPRDPLKAMGNILQVVNDVYKKGAQGLDIKGFLRVVNETVQRGNNNKLLSQLNQLYTRPGNWSGLFVPKSDEAVGRNALENSLSTFAFMSFGIFLLNQIHSFMGAGEGEEKGVRRGRKLGEGFTERSPDNIDFLFESPSSTPQKDESILDTNLGRAPTSETFYPTNSSSNVNNIFRAANNLVNAYTKDSQALECIWSKYCQDLDKTAGEHGSLYSVAARINSVGLRLIMGQIPTELTVDVVLRSLLGWDGLPCAKMFSKCQVVEGTLQSLEEAPENENILTTTDQTTA